MIALACVIGVLLWVGLDKTRLGAMVRAAVDDAEMARGVGIDTARISLAIFALGAFLAALGGGIGGAFTGVYPGLDFEILPLSFAVVIIGGLGSLRGAVVGSLIVGIFVQVSTLWVPTELKNVGALVILILILLVRPQGILGQAERVG